MGDKKGLFAGLGVAVLAAGGAAFYFRQAPAPAPQAPVVESTPAPAPALAPPARPEPAPTPTAAAVKLEESDALIREQGPKLSAHPRLAGWLRTDNLVRRLAAGIDNIADGASPRASFDFLSPRKRFTVIKRGDKFYLDPKSYGRYDPFAAVVASLDAQAAARLFTTLAPLFKDALRELGYNDREPKDNLVKAILELLKTPVVTGDIELEEKVLSYHIIDTGGDDLESLNDAQKHLLRMGPKNTLKIQAKLRELGRALGVPEAQLGKKL